MQDGCEVYMDSYVASYFMGHLDYFHKLLLGGRPDTKLEDHGTSNAFNRYDLTHDDPCHV